MLIAAVSSFAWLFIVGGDNFLLPSLLTTVAALVLFKKKIAPRKEVE